MWLCFEIICPGKWVDDVAINEWNTWPLEAELQDNLVDPYKELKL